VSQKKIPKINVKGVDLVILDSESDRSTNLKKKATFIYKDQESLIEEYRIFGNPRYDIAELKKILTLIQKIIDEMGKFK
jgi:hypothetical protein